jgi:hypothetical protein
MAAEEKALKAQDIRRPDAALAHPDAVSGFSADALYSNTPYVIEYIQNQEWRKNDGKKIHQRE